MTGPGSSRVAQRAGASPKRIPVRSDTAAVKAQVRQFRVDGHWRRIAGGDHAHEQGTAPPRHGHRQKAAEQCKDQAFGKKLTHQAAAAGSQREPDGDFAAPGGSAGQQQVGDIGARRQQHDAGHPHQQLQRESVEVAQAAVHAAGSRAEREVVIADEALHIGHAGELGSGQRVLQ